MALATDIITLDEAKAAVNITGTTFDTELASYVSAVSQALDQVAGPVVTRTVTDEYHDGGAETILLTSYPVVSVTTVTEYDDLVATVLSAESSTAQPADAYLLDPLPGIIRRRSSGVDYRFTRGRRNIKVTYAAGRYATTAAVDARFKQAAAMMLANVWRREQGVTTAAYGFGAAEPAPTLGATFFVPNAVREMLSDELRAPRAG